jgi:hypothetical protein
MGTWQQEQVEHFDDRIGHQRLVRQVAGERLDELQGVLLAMMREMQGG